MTVSNFIPFAPFPPMMKHIWAGSVTLLLTILTQVGGVIYLLTIIGLRRAGTFTTSPRPLRWMQRGGVAMGVYLFLILTVVPAAATYFGRVPLPVWDVSSLRPLSFLTPLCNRHYVDPRLYRVVREVAASNPKLHLAYLDANFPFWDGFPLLPHLSHDDGNKLDLAFIYKYRTGERAPWRAPAPLAYGAYEEPEAGEIHQTRRCKNAGYWQYDFTQYLVLFGESADLEFDAAATRRLVSAFADHPGIGKLFLEPHLQRRLNLTQGIIRFHGCRAVRHDDHLHVQL
jgi:hypothetical protein